MPKPVGLGSKQMGNRRKKLGICLVGASVLILAAILIALTCCAVKCQGQLKSSDLDEKLAHLEDEKRALEQQRDGARAEVTALRSELAGTNQTLWEMRGRWDSCRSLTHNLQNNITALSDKLTQLEARDSEREAKEQGLQDENGRLREQLSSQSQKLQDSQQEFQNQRDQLKANIHWLNLELQSQRNQRSSMDSLRGHSVSLYLALPLLGTLLL
ncbi:golgin subfamily A member 1-like [Mauremys reevesii]|uniref:golgin subfamily A member 1-like n=1 Tax=Mauremys reevesii TaxID=260615 RepID=UPI00193F03ED|nr:golgin subfamily A member 1-like [Mauremys reevesii]